MPTSNRDYLTIAELEEFADITVTDETEGLDRISQAEEMIDAYVRFQEKFLEESIKGLASSGSTSQITLQTDQQNVYDKDYFLGCMVEIIGGTNKGSRKRITASTRAGVLTTDTFSSAIDNTSFYKIWQIGKFPRYCDVEFYDQNGTTQYFKSIPEAVKRAVAAQVQFMIEMGDAYFASDKADLQSESIGDYSYTKVAGGSSLDKQIAPKAKILLDGIRNLKGAIIV